MQAYDVARFDPPVPLALVTVNSETIGIEIGDVPMLLDTGAVVSLLPPSHLESAGAIVLEYSLHRDKMKR